MSAECSFHTRTLELGSSTTAPIGMLPVIAWRKVFSWPTSSVRWRISVLIDWSSVFVVSSSSFAVSSSSLLD